MKETPKKKRALLHCALALATAPLAFGAAAQDFPPKKPVALVVGFAAGGAADAAARLIAMKLGENIGQSVVVDNKGGLLGERITSYFAAPPTALPHIETGRLIPLATTGLTRPAHLPNIPTVAESGLPGFEALNWYAFVAPGKTPVPLLERWNREIVKVLNDPAVKDAMNNHGLTPQPTSRAELTAFMKKESTQWAAIIKERQLTAD